jgi:hypothetical protein
MEHRQRLAEEKSTSGRVIAHLVKEASATPRSGSSRLLESGPYLIVWLKEFYSMSLGLFLRFRNARSPHSRDGRGFRMKRLAMPKHRLGVCIVPSK